MYIKYGPKYIMKHSQQNKLSNETKTTKKKKEKKRKKKGNKKNQSIKIEKGRRKIEKENKFFGTNNV